MNTVGKDLHTDGLQGCRGTASSAAQVTPEQELSKGWQLKEVSMKLSLSVLVFAAVLSK